MARRGRRIANALLAGLALAALAVLGALLLPASGPAQQLELEVTECGTEIEPEGCETEKQKVRRDRGEQRIVVPVAPEPKPRADASGGPAERHDVDLRRGTDRVRRTDGTKDREEKVEVDVAKPPKRERDEPGRDRPRGGGDDVAPEPSGALDPVTTSGGSPFAGFGAGMEFVSTDEALARFAVPPFLVPIYVAAGRAYGVPWNVLAAINQIETDFGRIGRQVSTAGALGWMQFMPATWRAYGVDASGDGIADPYNPVDAIYAAARYLKASGAGTDLRRAVFAYNRADWYVDSVLKTAGVYGSLPGGLVAETGSLAFGRFPVLGRVSYGDDFRRARAAGEPARGLWINGREGAAAIATQDVTVERILLDEELADAFRHKSVPRRGLRRDAPSAAPVPEGAEAGAEGPEVAAAGAAESAELAQLADVLLPFAEFAGAGAVAIVERMGAAAADRSREADRSGGAKVAARAPEPAAPGRLPHGFGVSDQRGIGVVVEDALGNQYRYSGLARLARGVRPGADLGGGEALGRLGGAKPAVLFSVRAAGGAAVDPRPLVDGYRLQEVADFQHAVAPLGGSPFVPEADAPAGGIVRGSQSELARRVLDDPGIDIYPGGRQDIARGIIDRRVLGALLYLRRNGLELTVTSLRSGHSFYTAGGNVSAHSFGAAVDIAAFNGQPVLGNQGPGSLVEQAIKLLMRLEADARPAQLISLMNLGGPSFALPDHNGHLHVGYTFEPSLGLGRSGDALGDVTFDGGASGMLAGGKADSAQARKLAGRLGGIDNPDVRRRASAAGLRVEGERPADTAAAEELARREQPLRAAPSAAGAQVVAIDVPEGARGDEAYAIGIVESSGGGWAKRQTVLLAHSDGAWRVLGPPRDRRDTVVNPDLVALATVSGGRGYAVGERGEVVVLRGDGAPLALGSVARADLAAVDARRAGGRVTGVAVGAAGTTVDLTGPRARVVRTQGRLTDVAYAGDSAVAVGRRSGGPLVARRTGAGWEPLAAPAPRRQATLTAVAGDAEALWVAGGVRDGAGAELPLVARYRGGAWETFCSGSPALAAVRELGEPTRGGECDRSLPLPPGTTGAAGDVATTRHGLVLATAGGLQLFDGQSFRSLPAAPGTWPTAASPSRVAPRLALTHPGPGWASGAGGRIARVTAADGAAGEPEGGLRPAALTRGVPAAVAAAPGGGRVLALTDRSAALRGGRDWGDAPVPQVPLRDVQWRTEDDAWAVAETGELLRFDGKRWSGDDGEDDARARLAWVLGGERYAAVGAPSGLASLAFRSADEGFAVGARGAASRFDGTRWVAERTPVASDLLAVAAGSEGVVAGGADGVVLERTGDGWERQADAEALADGRDLTAAATAADGTLVLAAGGAMLARENGEWQAAPVAPLGLDVRALRALRAPDGALRVVALAGPPESATLLLGDREGWRALTPGGIERVTDFDLDAATGTLWATGFAGDRAALAEVEVARAAAPVPEPLVEKERVYAHPGRAAVQAAKEGK